MPVSILAADIGGTNCRLGEFSLHQGELHLVQYWRCPTSSLHTTRDFLNCCSRHRPLSSYDALAVAVAGPVHTPYQAALTNGTLTLDLRCLAQQDKPRCLCLNDFLAQARACLTPAGQTALPLLSPAPCSAVRAQRRAVIGAGTGLGMALLVRNDAGNWQALPSEGGHCLFPFRGDEERALQQFFQHELGTDDISSEDLLSGRGLQRIHAFLTGEKRDAASIGQSSLQWESPTLQLFARVYGRICRHWALTTLCDAGLYITGGIAIRNPLLVQCQAFQEEFFRAPGFIPLLRRIPLFLLQDAASGVWGAAHAARELLDGNR